MNTSPGRQPPAPPPTTRRGWPCRARSATCCGRMMPGIVEAIIDAVPQLVPAYARPIEGRFGRGLRRGVAAALDRFLQLPGTRLPALSEESRQLVAGLGSGEFRQGRSMDALLSAYRMGARVTFREMSRVSVEHHLGQTRGGGSGRIDPRLHRRAVGGQRRGVRLRTVRAGRRGGPPAHRTAGPAAAGPGRRGGPAPDGRDGGLVPAAADGGGDPAGGPRRRAAAPAGAGHPGDRARDRRRRPGSGAEVPVRPGGPGECAAGPRRSRGAGRRLGEGPGFAAPGSAGGLGPAAPRRPGGSRRSGPTSTWPR